MQPGMRRPLVIALPACLLALLVTAAPAAALNAAPGEVTAIGVQMLYAGQPGENNNVVITQSGNEVTLTDSGSRGFTITPGSSCVQTSPTSATCTTAPGWVLGIRGGDGDDIIKVDSSLPALILGGNGDDILQGGSAGDEIGGENGDDVVSGGGGADILSGGNGYDTVDYSASLQPVSVSVDANNDDGALGEGDYVEPTFEAVRGSAWDDTLTAPARGGTLDGGGGSDILRGSAGDDHILAADGAPDTVTCGGGDDTVDGDALDTAGADCETVNRPAGAPGAQTATGATAGDGQTTQAVPKGAAVAGTRASGTVLITLPGGKTRELKPGEAIPATAVLDTTKGAVTLTAAPDAQGNVAQATFHGGRFQVHRTKDKQPVTELSLAGAAPSCAERRATKAVAAKKAKPAVRRLWGSGHGRFRTRGRYASAAVRGTVWLTEDRCSGTLVKVARGLVGVHDNRRNKTIAVPAGKQYLAHAR
jgi:hemolysin type calcium-binding protein